MKCRCCNQELYEFTQPALVPGKSARPMVECHTPGCALNMQTLDKASYPALDLTPYLTQCQEAKS